jgi:four helix bundle protein
MTILENDDYCEECTNDDQLFFFAIKRRPLYYMINNIYLRDIILDKTIKFSLDIIRYCEVLESERKYVIARQLLKSGTSIGANIKEAQNSESKADFIHKMKIAMKEADETEFWLFLCNELENYPNTEELLSEVFDILKITNKIISTTKKG